MLVRFNDDQIWSKSRFVSLSSEILEINESMNVNDCINQLIITNNSNKDKKVE